MSVRCAHCGEELLGAVNRCWKCGQQFIAQPTPDGLPPVRALATATIAVGAAAPSVEPLEARVLEDGEDPRDASLTETTVLVISEASAAGLMPSAIVAGEPGTAPPDSIFPLPPNPLATPSPYVQAESQPASYAMTRRYVPPRPNLAALGGAYGALLLGIFALVLAPFRWEAAIVAFVGLLMGIWGIYSPRRGWALIGMLLCALAMGWGTFTGMRSLWLYMNRNAPINVDEPLEEDALP